MRKLAFILIASLAFTACTNSEREHRDNAAADSTLPLLDTTNKAQTYTADVDLNGDEKVFLLNASLSAQRMHEFSHLGGQKAADKNLRTQAKKMEEEYSEMHSNLQAIAKGKGLLLTNNEIPELAVLKGLSGIAFDRKFNEFILMEHANLVEQLNVGLTLPNADIKNFATNSLPLVNENNSNMAKILR